ncbi:tRNA (adenosine(37)-N6)-dimethylallyltransferase MiaA [uncultured Eudoraea sp.]|uniref:tRNA (adenosine(37)-N6)-dimethylallyltransferase MiaA n=1 Tax=uncultured Eudoraea sp. TaxID=1035614 RepID=UPI00261152D7|nr:tRNA (adenosine(37)-N6)-dimethylallyltransferase MiaA [uncultured Eudoraea sp.]
MKKVLITVIGPTAIGKTKLAIDLATHFKTEIISSDSRQFYKEMSIGTAVPSRHELESIPHHFIQHKSIHQPYNVGDFEKDALKILENLFKKHDNVVMVGGSGLYIDAVVKGLDTFPEVDREIRTNLNSILKQQGIEVLQKQLKELDPEYYKKVDIQNPHRIIRALEICHGTGKAYSSFINKRKLPRPFSTIMIGLFAERSILYDKINKRVDSMIENGLEEEARSLHKHKHLNALQTVGYTELFNFFDGNWDLDFAISEIKKNTRRFAKRQLTWFRKNKDIVWVEPYTPINEIIEKIMLLRINLKDEAGRL